MILCHRVAGSMGTRIPRNESEAAFKSFDEVLACLTTLFLSSLLLPLFIVKKRRTNKNV